MELILPEIVAVGIYNTSVAVKRKTVTDNRKTVMFEIELPIEKGGVSSINAQQMPIDTNTLICAKPGQIRHTKLPFVCYYMHIIVQKGSIYETLMGFPDFIKTEKSGIYRTLFERLYKYYEGGVGNHEMILQSIILEIIYTLAADAKRITAHAHTKSNNYTAIEKSIAYIKENPTENLSLDRLAATAGFSKVYFHNCFKASTGQTLHAYVETQRMKMAANMLVSTNKTLTEIAYECGFSSQSYFSYAFKRKTGLTPREYVCRVYEQFGE